MLDPIPLPRFRQPRPPDDPPPSDPPSDPPASPPASPPSDPPSDSGPPELPPPSPAPPAAARGRTSATRSDPADPVTAATVLAGLLAIGIGLIGLALTRTGRHLRQPTRDQLADITGPLGAIAARRLPADVITGDLADVATSAAAVYHYAVEGPLITRTPAVDYPEEQM